MAIHPKVPRAFSLRLDKRMENAWFSPDYNLAKNHVFFMLLSNEHARGTFSHVITLPCTSMKTCDYQYFVSLNSPHGFRPTHCLIKITTIRPPNFIN